MSPFSTAPTATPPSSGLPTPSADAIATSAELARRIVADIDAHDGWISFTRYMDACLYTPHLGYYSGALTKLGANPADGSDFVTAPELTPLFGRSLAHQVAQILDASDRRVLEFGAGSGRLAADLLRELERLDMLPEQYAILDLSADLRARQRATLARAVPHLLDRVVWLDTLPEQWSGAVIANEVLDAMPVQRVVWRAGQWQELGIAHRDGVLYESERPAVDATLATLRATIPATAALPDGYGTEIHAAATGFIASLATRIRRGAALLIDYGFPAHEYYHPQRAEGTLMAHYRHRAHGDVLRWPGLQDLTAHVDFSAIARTASEHGLDVLGYTSQAHFLINCGIATLIDARADDALAWLPQANALQRLVSEAEMGELFKVIALGRGIDTPLLGFARGERAGML